MFEDVSDEELAAAGITREQHEQNVKDFQESMRCVAEAATDVSKLLYDRNVHGLEIGLVAALLLRSACSHYGKDRQYFEDIVNAYFITTPVVLA